ncbi:MAG: pepP, partial [Propionibacteriaceae bacterium]|nr:pepP [Propionibacteriaceae bacterium]
SRCGIRCAPIDQLADDLAKNADSTRLRAVLPPADTFIEHVLNGIRSPVSVEQADEHDQDDETSRLDSELAVALSELRLIKDEFEISQLREACEHTARAFGAVVADLPEAIRRGRGERWVEGVFGLHARHVGNAVGYDTIAAAGDHACTLHWIRNDGDLRDGDLMLMDAGVELDTLYTADVTRTLPINGRFSDDQRMVYEAVLEAQQAGMAAARPGAKFSDVHKAAVAVIARHLHEWGLLPITPEESLAPDGGLHRRWMVHGTSHHLGIDVHDCSQARVENYREGTLRPGMVFTVEPGLYFKPDDELVPDHLRGIGVRIEDDIVITETGCENLSAGLPRASADVEAWMSSIWNR